MPQKRLAGMRTAMRPALMRDTARLAVATGQDRRQASTSLESSRAPPALLALFAGAPDSAVRAHALAAAVVAYASDSVVLADARAPQSLQVLVIGKQLFLFFGGVV